MKEGTSAQLSGRGELHGGARVTTLVTLRKCTLGNKREIKTLKFVSASTKGFKGGLAWIKPSKKDMAVTFSYFLNWDGYGPSRTRGDFFDFQFGGHDGAYKGRIHVIVPFIGRKNGTLTARQQCFNDVHGWYTARIEQLFARLWHWGWLGTSAVAAPTSYTSQSAFCCISLSFASGTMGACPASCLDRPK